MSCCSSLVVPDKVGRSEGPSESNPGETNTEQSEPSALWRPPFPRKSSRQKDVKVDIIPRLMLQDNYVQFQFF